MRRGLCRRGQREVGYACAGQPVGQRRDCVGVGRRRQRGRHAPDGSFADELHESGVWHAELKSRDLVAGAGEQRTRAEGVDVRRHRGEDVGRERKHIPHVLDARVEFLAGRRRRAEVDDVRDAGSRHRYSCARRVQPEVGERLVQVAKLVFGSHVVDRRERQHVEELRHWCRVGCGREGGDDSPGSRLPLQRQPHAVPR